MSHLKKNSNNKIMNQKKIRDSNTFVKEEWYIHYTINLTHKNNLNIRKTKQKIFLVTIFCEHYFFNKIKNNIPHQKIFYEILLWYAFHHLIMHYIPISITNVFYHVSLLIPLYYNYNIHLYY